jgi:hypothetical protein
LLKQNIGLPACCGGHDDALRLFETRIVVVVDVDVVVELVTQWTQKLFLPRLSN